MTNLDAFNETMKTINESTYLKTGVKGYKSFFLECVNGRMIVESIMADSTASALGSIANKTLTELGKEDKADSMRMNALLAFYNKIQTIGEQIKAQYYEESDENKKMNLYDLLMKYKFIADPEKDAILKRAMLNSKIAQGNRVATFIRSIIQGISAKNATSPIAEFKNQVMRLKSEIEKFYNPSFPFQASIKGYEKDLLGPDGLVDILEKIMDQISASTADIEKAINPTKGTFGNKTFQDVSGNFQTSHKYESAVMEAYAASLSYFARKRI